MHYNYKYPEFSFFKYPVTNLRPKRIVSIKDVYRGITSGYNKHTIEQIRNASSNEIKRELKTKSLDFVTFAGKFSTRNSKGLIQKSGYTCIDFDHIEPEIIPEIKNKLLNNPTFETELLFTSPGGAGLKWVIELKGIEKFPYETYYKGVMCYLKAKLQLGDYIDPTGKDIARACFMSYDPDAFINSKYL